MKRSSSTLHKRTNKAIAAFVICMTVFAPTLSLAASATVNFGFSGVTQPVQSLVAPKEAGTTSTTFAPVFKSVQATTEIDTTRSFAQPAEVVPTVTQPTDVASAVAQPVETTPSGAPKQAATASSNLKIGIGINALLSDDLKIYTVPLSYTINRNFVVMAAIPVVTAKFDDINGASKTNTGIGDVGFTIKNRIGSENRNGVLFSIVTAKFPTGDADKGLGTGTYDITLTEKVIKRFGDYRGTLMAGVTQPLNDPTILGSKIEYGTTISYMAAIDRTVVLPDLWFGVRAEGMHSFETRINGLAQGNALTTLDMVPEFKYYFKRNSAINLGVNVPVYTDYALTGGSKTRQVSANFGVSTMF
jgi:hypothetical protein